MTVLDDRPLVQWGVLCEGLLETPEIEDAPARRTTRGRPARPAPARPAVAPLSFRGYGVRVSRAPHTRRPVSTAVVIGLAGLTALITLWLGLLAHLSVAGSAAPESPADQLAVVQVQAGETLQHVAGRVAPDSPVGQVVDRIRELNNLDSASVDVGQTLIAPIR